MEDYLIVDGYNIINAWPELIELKEINLDHARKHLIDVLSNYRALKGNKVLIVYDGHQVKGGVEKKETITGIEVIYSSEGETADMVIEKIVPTLPKHSLVCVATSDWTEQRIVLGKGAFRVSARELLERITQAEKESEKHIQVGEKSKQTLDGFMSDDVREKLEKWRRHK